MRTTMDKAGRVIIPAALRAHVGLVPGPVDIYTDGVNVVIEAVPGARLVEEDGRLVIAADGETLTTDQLRELRLALQR